MSLSNVSPDDDDLRVRFRQIAYRLASKLIDNGSRRTRTLYARRDRLRNFIDQGNPDAPFDLFSEEELGAELYHDVENIARDVIRRFPKNRDRERYLWYLDGEFAGALTFFSYTGGRRPTRRRGQGRRTRRG